MAKTGRPRIEIDQDQFEKLCGLQCTEVEICGWFHCCEDTLNSWCKRTYDGDTFSETYKKHSANGKISIRRAQFKLMEKNATMAIFLGKQYLGQSDGVLDMANYDKAKEILEGVHSVIDEETN